MALDESEEELAQGVSATVTDILGKSLELYRFYIPSIPMVTLEPVRVDVVASVASNVTRAVYGTVHRAVRIVVKNIARTYMALKAYFELGLSVPASVAVYFINHFIRIIAGIAYNIASKCIGITTIVLTVPYAVKRLRQVAEQEYDIKKPLTSIYKMVASFADATRDIFITFLASVFAGATICTFAKCPAIEAMRPPFISLPDWYVFEDFCADMCRLLLIQMRLRDYMACVGKCISMLAPRKPTESVVVTAVNRVTVYVNEYSLTADTLVNPYRPTITEAVAIRELVRPVVRKRNIINIAESIAESILVANPVANVIRRQAEENTKLRELMTVSLPQRVTRHVAESTVISDTLVLSTAMQKAVHTDESVSSTDLAPAWVPLPPIRPYARWIEAVSEYIDPYFGASVVAIDTLTGEVIRVGEIGTPMHSAVRAFDTAEIALRSRVQIDMAEDTRGLVVEQLLSGLLRRVELESPYTTALNINMVHTLRLLKSVGLESPHTTVLSIEIPYTPLYRRFIQLITPIRLATIISAVHSTRMKTGVQLATPSRLTASTSTVHSIRTRTGVQLATPTKACVQIAITA